MINQDELVFVEQAVNIYGKMNLLELLSEENMLQTYAEVQREIDK